MVNPGVLSGMTIKESEESISALVERVIDSARRVTRYGKAIKDAKASLEAVDAEARAEYTFVMTTALLPLVQRLAKEVDKLRAAAARPPPPRPIEPT